MGNVQPSFCKPKFRHTCVMLQQSYPNNSNVILKNSKKEMKSRLDWDTVRLSKYSLLCSKILHCFIVAESIQFLTDEWDQFSPKWCKRLTVLRMSDSSCYCSWQHNWPTEPQHFHSGLCGVPRLLFLFFSGYLCLIEICLMTWNILTVIKSKIEQIFEQNISTPLYVFNTAK